MARIARVVVPGHPHRMTQRGSRRQRTFFNDVDYRCYIDLLANYKGENTKTGRPAGGEEFLRRLEAATGRMLRRAKPGPKHRSSQLR